MQSVLQDFYITQSTGISKRKQVSAHLCHEDAAWVVSVFSVYAVLSNIEDNMLILAINMRSKLENISSV